MWRTSYNAKAVTLPPSDRADGGLFAFHAALLLHLRFSAQVLQLVVL